MIYELFYYKIKCYIISQLLNPLNEMHYPDILQKYMNILLIETNSKIIKSIISSLCVIFTNCSDYHILPYLYPIIDMFHHVFDRVIPTNKILLLDMISIIIEIIGYHEVLCNQQVTSLYIPHIMKYFDTITIQEDYLLIPMMECFITLFVHIKEQSQEYIAYVYMRCYSIIYENFVKNENIDVIIYSIDVITSIIEGYENSCQYILTNIDDLLTLLFTLLQSPHSDIRQSSFSLIGELLKHYPNLYSNHRVIYISKLIDIIMNNLSYDDYPMVYNNAIWVLGLLCQRIIPPSHIMEYLTKLNYMKLIQYFIMTFQYEHVSDTLLENIAITIGILAIHTKDWMIPVIDDFFSDWCR